MAVLRASRLWATQIPASSATKPVPELPRWEPLPANPELPSHHVNVNVFTVPAGHRAIIRAMDFAVRSQPPGDFTRQAVGGFVWIAAGGGQSFFTGFWREGIAPDPWPLFSIHWAGMLVLETNDTVNISSNTLIPVDAFGSGMLLPINPT